MTAASGSSSAADGYPNRQHHNPFTPCGTKRGRSSSEEAEEDDDMLVYNRQPAVVDMMAPPEVGETSTPVWWSSWDVMLWFVRV